MTVLDNDLRRALDISADPASVGRLSALVHALAEGSSATVPPASDVAGAAAPRIEPSGQRRTRLLAPLLAAAAVAAVTAGVMAVSAPDRSSDTGAATGPTATSTPTLSWALRMRPVAGLRFTRDTTTLRLIGRTGAPTVESSLRFTDAAGSPASGRITYYATALGPRVSDKRQRSVVVDGRTVRYTPAGAFTLPHTARPWDQANGAVLPDLIGSTPDGGSIEVQSTFGFDPITRRYDEAASLRLLARVLHAAVVGGGTPPTAPFRIRSLDPRLYPDLVEVNTTTGLGTVGLSFPRTCLGFTSGNAVGPRSGALDGSYLVFCRFPTQDDAVDAKACGVLDGHSGQVVVRTLGDGTSLCGQLDLERNESHISGTELRRYVERADVSPALRKPETWLTVR